LRSGWSGAPLRSGDALNALCTGGSSTPLRPLRSGYACRPLRPGGAREALRSRITSGASTADRTSDASWTGITYTT
jgi:hypothetical protein